MNIEIDNAILELNQHRNLSLRHADGDCIHVHWGRVWVTRAGDIRDHFVNSGESFAIDRPGTTVLTAMSDAGVSLMRRCAPSAAMAGATPVDRFAGAGEWIAPANGDDRDFPGYGEIDRRVDCAHRLRARYVAAAFRNVWTALRRALTG